MKKDHIESEEQEFSFKVWSLYSVKVQEINYLLQINLVV